MKSMKSWLLGIVGVAAVTSAGLADDTINLARIGNRAKIAEIGAGHGGAVVALELFPTEIALDGRFAYAQLLVTGELESGDRVDLTRDARASVTGGVVDIGPTGIVRAVRDGAGSVQLEVAGLERRVAVTVSGVSSSYEASYVRDVAPILSKVGCNSGTCHGSAEGKNGFKLSLRGYDPVFDYQALIDDLEGRRFNRTLPERSLFLLKPTGGVPHVGGGDLIQRDGRSYRILESWVEQGVKLDLDSPRVARIEVLPRGVVMPLPGMSQQMVVLAHYTDGTVRDVSEEAFVETNDIDIASVTARGLVTGLRRGETAILARYEGSYNATRFYIMGDRSGFEWQEVTPYDPIDTLVYEKLQKVKTLPSEPATDAEFARRVYLDLTGLPPTAREIRTFLLDGRDSRRKREELVDRLLGSAEFVEYWTNKWADLLQVNQKFLGDGGADALRDWIRRCVASDLRYDEFVSQILTATGPVSENPAAGYYLLRAEPDALMENTTQLFLGVRFNCNKCHDHPFERWTQSNHWELAAYFARVESRKDKQGRTVVYDKEEGEVKAPYNGLVVAPSFPYEYEALAPAKASAATRREALARWMTDEENPYFARSFVNRVWSYFLGVGIIDPVDDIRASNPPTNPKLLDYLTETFIQSGMSTRALMRKICKSRVYQHSVRTSRWNEDDGINFSHALARRLPAETLYDAIHLVTGSTTRLPGVRRGTRAAELPGPEVKPSDGFLDLFGRPARESSCECERSTGMSLGQALNLVNGPTVSRAINDPENAIANLLAVEQDSRAIVGELFLSILSRRPTEAERDELARTLDVRRLENAVALAPEAGAALEKRFAEWIAANRPAEWAAAEIGLAKSAEGATIERLADGALRVSGEAPAKDVYTVVAWTDLARVTGLRLEVLDDEALGKSKGPGRADTGNFVLSEIRVAAASAGKPADARAVDLDRASADYDQGGFDIARAIDGNEGTGWAIGGREGRPHTAVFQFKEDVAATGGTILTVTLEQKHGDRHTLGKFRLSVTGADRPVRWLDYPEEVLAILRADPASYTAEQRDTLFEHYIRTDDEMAAQMRLSAAQDLSWALINSPAFLFNH